MEFIEDNYFEDDFSENIFLDSLHKKNVNVFLLGGFKLTGKFHGYDDKSILLNRDNEDLLVYKWAISTISKFKQNNHGRG